MKYMEMHPEVEIRIVPIEEAGVSQRISTAVAANRLPDIIRMGIERVAAFAADGILDEDAAVATIQAIGEDDFRAGPLEMVTDPATGKYAAIPFDGWIQAIWYREDLYKELGLNAPIKWEDITASCQALPGNDDLLYGITLGTDPGQNYGHQVLSKLQSPTMPGHLMRRWQRYNEHPRNGRSSRILRWFARLRRPWPTILAWRPRSL